MLDIQIDNQHHAILVQGHSEDPKVCGAITALLGGLAIIAHRAIFIQGMSFLELEPEDQLDFDAISFGVVCIARAEGRCVRFVDKIDGLKQIQ